MYQGFAKFIRGKAFRALFLILSLILACYISFRVGLMLEYYFSIKVSGILFVILILFLLYMLLYQSSKKKIKKTRRFYEGCTLLLCLMMNLVLCLLAQDLIRLLIPIVNEKTDVLAVFIALVLTFYGFFHAKRLYIKHYDLPLNHKIKPIKVALLSDIHTGTFVNCRQLKRIVDTTNQLQCDYILITGDTFDVEAFEYCHLSALANELQKLKAAKGVYAILGNHDPASTDERILQFFQECKIHLLIDESIETDDFILIGRDDINTNPNRKTLDAILQPVNSNKPIIVMDHNPVGIKDGIYNHVDVVVSGHTHKGQFFPATLFTKWSYGQQGFYGASTTDQTVSVVSSGSGYFQMPMRIGTNSEIVEIEFHSKA